jgi:hypothetical protein
MNELWFWLYEKMRTIVIHQPDICCERVKGFLISGKTPPFPPVMTYDIKVYELYTK